VLIYLQGLFLLGNVNETDQENNYREEPPQRILNSNRKKISDFLSEFIPRKKGDPGLVLSTWMVLSPPIKIIPIFPKVRAHFSTKVAAFRGPPGFGGGGGQKKFTLSFFSF